MDPLMLPGADWKTGALAAADTHGWVQVTA